MTEATKDDKVETEATKPIAKKRAPRKVTVKAAKEKKKVADLHAEALVDQKDGSPRPLSAITDNLQATVKGDMGRVLFTMAQKDYIGQEPIVILAVHADEFRDILDQLDAAADARLAEES